MTAQTTSTVLTSISSLQAKFTGTGESLTINESDDLLINAGNVTTTSGDIAITLAAGNLS